MPRGGSRSPTVWPSALQQMLEVPLAPKPEPGLLLPAKSDPDLNTVTAAGGIKLNSPHLTPVNRKVYQLKTECKDVDASSPQTQFYITTTTPQQRLPIELVSAVYNSGGLTSEGSCPSDHDYGMTSSLQQAQSLSSDPFSVANTTNLTPITPSPSSHFSRLTSRPLYVTPGSEGSNTTRQTGGRGGGSVALNAALSKSGGAVKSKARRWLNLDNGGEGQEPEGFKTPIKPASATKRKLEISSSPSPHKVAKSPAEKTRYETSLGLLTKKFVSLFHTDPNNTVDLNKASESLQVQKRRIYDITNVLEGVGLVEKKSKNTVHWCGGGGDVGATCSTQSDLDQLEAQEKKLDDLIRNTELEIKLLNEDKQYAYVSYQDLRNVPRFKNQTVMAIKAPPEAKLHVPHPSDGLKIYMSSETGEIEVFLCPEEESLSGGGGGGESASDLELSPIKTRIMLSEANTTSEHDNGQDDELKRIIESSLSAAAAAAALPPSAAGAGVNSSNNNNIISSLVNSGVNLGTTAAVDHNNGGVSAHVVTAPAAASDLFSAADASNLVVEGIPLDPPLEDDYVLSLDDHELLKRLLKNDLYKKVLLNCF
eukprot:TRINITY_DN3841_c0_g1_i1.p1 TRINITY_DN3841_c0_g1~~TRINITY_DN3841_c0_g1_i1.p1  ORF type:complete len:593 (-),score=166.58 TRINITY_DN3841_c0_g1_i1:516-2294(-)